jgi:hypothetical protein
MSQHVQDLPRVRFRIQRPSVPWLVGLALAVAILTTSTMLIVLNDGGTDSQTSRVVNTSVGGPNEVLRGSAVAAASGVPFALATGGVNESARGSSVATATGVPSALPTGGVNESARGSSVATATGVPSALPTGGVNESARGSSVATAFGAPASPFGSLGVNETARGQAAASASR